MPFLVLPDWLKKHAPFAGRFEDVEKEYEEEAEWLRSAVRCFTTDGELGSFANRPKHYRLASMWQSPYLFFTAQLCSTSSFLPKIA